MPKDRVIRKFEFEQLRGFLELPEFDDEIIADAVSAAGQEAFDDAIADELEEEQAEEARVNAEDQVASDAFREYANAVEWAGARLFERHGMDLSEEPDGSFTYVVTAPGGIEPAAQAVLLTFNGAGPFWIDGLEEFLAIGPYEDLYEAVDKHLGWVRSQPEVFQDSSIDSLFEQALR